MRSLTTRFKSGSTAAAFWCVQRHAGMRDLMGVHRKGEAGGAAMIGQRAQHRRQFVNVRPAASELAGRAGFHQARRFQQRDIVGDVFVFVRGSGALGENRAEFLGGPDQVAGFEIARS